MPGRAAYSDHLESVRLFRACSKRDLQKIAKASDEISVPDGKVLIQEGSVGRECFVILEGKASVRIRGRRVATLGPGDSFGELALLDHGPRTATIEADGPMKVLVLESRHFLGLLDEVPALAHKVLAGLASTVRELDSKLFT